MKKLLSVLIVIFAFVFVSCKEEEVKTQCEQIGHNYIEGLCSVCGEIDSTYNPIKEPEKQEEDNHIIKDKDGNFGGSYNEALYGLGAPLNGEYDFIDSPYYVYNDYYNMYSTNTRTLVPKFRSYQQTMKNTSGIACALMVMNYSNEDLTDKDEFTLATEYNDLTNTNIFENEATPEGLDMLFKKYGYITKTGEYKETSTARNDMVLDFSDWLQKELAQGRLVLVRFQDNYNSGWKVIIGFDDMGTESNGLDNVVIFADPFDAADHKQDGYSVMAAGRFYRWWHVVEFSGVIASKFEYIIVAPKIVPDMKVREETVFNTNEAPEKHLYLNKDGSYGGSSNVKLYGNGTSKDGVDDNPNTIYYMIPDCYNWTSEGSLTMLPRFRAFQQTMASSCGICSTMVSMLYQGVKMEDYGVDNASDFEEYLVKKYEKITGKIIYNSGVGSSGLKSLTGVGGNGEAGFGFKPIADSYSRDKYVDKSSMNFPEYEDFKAWTLKYLRQGTPIPISWRPQGGHWQVIIGFDDMGTPYIYDDVLILADSGDGHDHYRDGYDIFPATLFYRQWYNGSFTYNQQYNVFTLK